MTTETTAPAKNWFKRHPYLTGIGGIIIFLIIVGSIGDSKSSKEATSAAQKQAAQSAEVIQISASKLAQAYIANEVSADALYKGNVLAISGTVKDISKDILDTPYVIIESNPSDYFTQVQCMFTKSDEAALVVLKKGAPITLQGEVSGKLMNIQVRNCSIVTQ